MKPKNRWRSKNDIIREIDLELAEIALSILNTRDSLEKARKCNWPRGVRENEARLARLNKERAEQEKYRAWVIEWLEPEDIDKTK